MFDTYMCWCNAGASELQKSIDDSTAKTIELPANIKESESKKAQIQADLAKAQSDRSAAKSAMATATGIREKDGALFKKETSDLDANIDSMSKAIAALEKGMSGSFLQSGSAQFLRNLIDKAQDVLEGDRQEVMSFLSGGDGNGYVPAGGSVIGILKQMHDSMSKSRSDAAAAEASAVTTYDALMAAKKKEVDAVSAAVESKTVRVGELAVEIVQMKNDLSESEAALVGSKDFLANMAKDCKTKTDEWDDICKTRSEELVAISETINILNDDDALELFKKTLPSASASFVQMQVGSEEVRAQALALVQEARRSNKSGRQQLDLIGLALNGRKTGFGKVIKMVDDLIALLKTEQSDDDNKKEYCHIQFDALDDKKKGLERAVSDAESAIDEAKDSLETLAREVKSLKAGIKDLDKSIADATEQRKSEHEEFSELMSSDGAAKELLGFAKNRLNKFYNPRQYNAPAKRELSEEDRITVANGGTLAPTAAPGGIAGTGVAVMAEISAHDQQGDAVPPPPEAVGAYKKKSGESSGVIAMVDLLVKDLEKEMTEAKVDETNAQADYEQLLDDAAARRAADTKALTEKANAKSQVEGDLQDHNDGKDADSKELMATGKVIQGLHGECDWLLQNFVARKNARNQEIDSLGNAKAVLSGADFSLLQTKIRSLRGQL